MLSLSLLEYATASLIHLSRGKKPHLYFILTTNVILEKLTDYVHFKFIVMADLRENEFDTQL